MKRRNMAYIYFCTGHVHCKYVDSNGRFTHTSPNLKKCPKCRSKVNRVGEYEVRLREFGGM
jgi:hypothetical protein